MSSTALKTLAVVLVGLALVLGFVAYQLSQGLTQAPEVVEKPKPEPGADQVLAVVATTRIPAYEPIPAESVALVPISVEPPQYFTDVNSVVGRTALRAIPVGSPVTNESFGSANTLAQAIPPGTQAMSFEISDVIAVGGFVKPGDIVDVLVYIRSSGSEVENSQARVLLKSARLLAYEERLINGAEEESKDGTQQQSRRQRTAVLAVPEKQTTKAMLGASLGDLRLALRGPDQVIDFSGVDNKPIADGDKPEALAQLASNDASPKQPDDDKKSKEDRDEEEKVITLSELTEIKQNRRAKDAPKPPPRATIEVYEGTELKRISRPY